MTTIPIEHIDTDREVFVWPDMSEQLPCERPLFNPYTICARPAEWVLYRSCCTDRAKYALYCTEHKDFILQMPFVVCRFCGSETTPATAFFMLIEPLNQRPTS